MENMTIKRVSELCDGKIVGQGNPETLLSQIVIDSRKVSRGDLFAAYRGEHTDGHMFIASAMDHGAACCLAEYVPEGEQRMLILVPNVQTALEQLAAAYRSTFDMPVVGITGSVGKTTTKEMIAAVLEEHFCLLKTEGNLNNQIGIPMMLSRLESRHQAAVIEMGISDFGEMRCLSRMVQPTMGVFTVIGHAHLEFLHDLEGVLAAKTEMLETLPETAPVLVNGDDEKLHSLVCRQRKLSFGLNPDNDVRAEGIFADHEQTYMEIVCGLRRIPVTVPAFGRHIVYAALAAASAGMLLGLSDEEIRRGLLNFHNVGRRSEVLHTGYLTLMDDSYNANPDSVCCGIDSLLQLTGKRHICILGDMLELGDGSPQMHEKTGRYAIEKGVDLVLSAGQFAADTCRGAAGQGVCFSSRDELIQSLPFILRENDCILVKASKSSHFETVAASIRALRKDYRPSVIFDLDDTILDFQKAEAVALSKSLDELGIQHDETMIRRYHVINLEHWEALENGMMTREEVLTHRFTQFLREYGIRLDAAALRDQYENNLAIGHYFINGAEELLKTLSGNYRLFLASNGTASVQEKRLASAGIKDCFEQVFISEELGANKPEPVFFERCFARIRDFDKSRCVIVGDGLNSDIRGGINAGIKTCWFNYRKSASDAEILPDAEILSLSELPDVLKRLTNS